MRKTTTETAAVMARHAERLKGLGVVDPVWWNYHLRRDSRMAYRAPLALSWEANGSSRAYDNDLAGWEAWEDWREFEDDRMFWSVESASGSETAPFGPHQLDSDNFLSYFTWPVDDDGRRLRWTDLPVIDGKSEWLRKLTGWRPAPLTASVPVAALESQRETTA